MKVIITLILSAFLLTSCSNPDTSGGVTLHKFGPRPADARDCWPQCPQEEPEPDEANNTKEPEPDPPTTTDEFPHGLCTGPTELGDKSQTTGCGYLSAHGSRYYIMPGVTLKWPNLSGVNLAGANLSRAFLKLDASDWTNMNLSGANLSRATVAGYYSHSNLSGANLSNAMMFQTSLRHTNLRGADLRHTNLSGAVLINTDLRGANLFWADLGGTFRQGVKGDWNTICPNGKRWGTAGNDCGF
jgi:hypothetical protein